MKKLIKYLITSSLSLTMIGCTKEQTQTYSQTYSDIGFDTVITFKATCTESEFNQYADIVKSTFLEYDKYFDQYTMYDDIHNICYLNKYAYNNPIDVNDVLLECIETSFAYTNENDNFDITYGDLLDVWHTYREENKTVPSKDEIDEALLHGGKDKIQIKDHTITYLDSDFKLDLGAIAKGFTCEKIKDKLHEAGLDNGFINAGGNIVLLGEKKDGTNWNIGIQNPDGNESCAILSLSGVYSIVTSGDYQRYYTVNGTRYSHIIDLHTGYPATYMRSVTIITDDSSLADYLSTALFCMDYESGYAFVKERQKYNDIEVVWIFNKGSVENAYASLDNLDLCCTDGIKDKLTISE